MPLTALEYITRFFLMAIACQRPDKETKVDDTMDEDDLRAEIERLKAENAALKSKEKRGTLTMKVSEKGALSIYGLGRFPVTLYKEQWLKLLDIADDIRQFIQANDSLLKTKD